MDAKKKRNKKKKGNHTKNADDVVSNAGEAAPQYQNHDSAMQDNQNGVNAEDAMSSVGEVVPSYQNHEPAPRENHNGANADDAASSAGGVVPCCQNDQLHITQENHKATDAVHSDMQSVEVSDSGVELNKHKLYAANFDKLHEKINQLEDDQSSWLQKVSNLESELNKLQSKVGYHVHNEALLEERVNSLQNGYDALVKKEVILDNEMRCKEDINDSLIQKENSLKETISGLDEANKALQIQVKALEESSKNTVEENQRLVMSLDEMKSRIQILEAKSILNEASKTKEVPAENKVMDQMDLTGPLPYQQNTGFSEGNELITSRGHSSTMVVVSEDNHSHLVNQLQETSVQLPETTVGDNDKQGFIDVNVHHRPKHEFDEAKISEEIVAVPLDDIQIHEEEPPAAMDKAVEEVPLTDAPLIGAPFRLFSFVAKYVSGADLVNQKTSQSHRQPS